MIDLNTLAAAYAENKLFKEVVLKQEEAIKLIKFEKGNQARLQEYEEHLYIYQNNTPWREYPKL